MAGSGKGSRDKGRKFEALVCNMIRDTDRLAAVRRGKQSHLADEPDVVIESGPFKILWIECHHGRESISKKLVQAERDVGAAPRVVVVIWRRTGQPVQATIRASTLVYLRTGSHPPPCTSADGVCVSMLVGDFLELVRTRTIPVL